MNNVVTKFAGMTATGLCLMWVIPASAQQPDEVAIAETATDVAVKEERAIAPELSVPPLDHIEYPDDRPGWVDDKPDFSGDDHTIVVISGPCETVEECEEELQWAQGAAIKTYVSELVDSPGGADFFLGSRELIAEQLIADRYTGKVEAGGETNYEQAVRLNFDLDTQTEIRAAWRDAEVGKRLTVVGAMTGFGTLLLMCSGGLLGIASRRLAKKQRNSPEN